MNAEDYEWFGFIPPEDVKDGVIFITPLAFFSQDGIWESSHIRQAFSTSQNQPTLAISA